MKKNGFTLVVVTAVVIILAILIVLVVPKVSSIIRKNKEKVCLSIKTNAESAAEDYTLSHVNEIDTAITNNNHVDVTLLTLMQAGLLEKDLKNPFNQNDISTSNVVRITKSGNVYTYTYMGEDCA